MQTPKRHILPGLSVCLLALALGYLGVTRLGAQEIDPAVRQSSRFEALTPNPTWIEHNNRLRRELALTAAAVGDPGPTETPHVKPIPGRIPSDDPQVPQYSLFEVPTRDPALTDPLVEHTTRTRSELEATRTAEE